MLAKLKLASSALALWLSPVLVGCHASERPSSAPPAIALSTGDELLYVARDDALWLLPIAASDGPKFDQSRELGGPCSLYVDLEVWEGQLFALCGDGRTFSTDEPGPEGDPGSPLWTELPRTSPPLAWLQRSDLMLLGVTESGALHVLASDAPHDPEHAKTLDRFRGHDRGGPGELPVVSIDAGGRHAVHSLVLRHGPELVAGGEDLTMTCRVRARRARVTDLAVSPSRRIAATIVDRRGQSFVVHARPLSEERVSVHVFDFAGGEHVHHPSARCER